MHKNIFHIGYYPIFSKIYECLVSLCKKEKRNLVCDGFQQSKEQSQRFNM